MKVLVAEDDVDQLAVRCMLLEASGFETIAAADAQSAIELAAEHQPQCAVVDVRLPTEETGLRLIRELKGLHPSMRAVVLTGMNAERISGRPEARLIDVIILKGTPAVELINALKAIAAQRESEARA